MINIYNNVSVYFAYISLTEHDILMHDILMNSKY